MANIEKVVRGITRRKIATALGKTERLNVLVTPEQKMEIRAAAKRYRLSMTDYLMRLHALVEAHNRLSRPATAKK